MHNENYKMTDDITPEESALTFPCEFTIKVFGEKAADFEKLIYDLILPFVPSLSSSAIQTRNSENGKYLSLSITLYVHSREQLDNIYRALTSSPRVLMAL
jgi:putative lipoic acid-binding regulatory protein